MVSYTETHYRKYGYLLLEHFQNLKSIFKRERYDTYIIFSPTEFSSRRPDIIIPSTTAAVLEMIFTYDGINGQQRLSRYCFLDGDGFRIPEPYFRPFEQRVDRWLDQISEIHMEAVQPSTWR